VQEKASSRSFSGTRIFPASVARRGCRERRRLAPIRRTRVTGRAGSRPAPRRLGALLLVANVLPAPTRDVKPDDTTARRIAGKDCAAECGTVSSSPDGRRKIFSPAPHPDGPRRPRRRPAARTTPAAAGPARDSGDTAPADALGPIPSADTAAPPATATSAAPPDHRRGNNSEPADARAETAAHILSADTGASAACGRHE
jgi:hypothetical protein